MAIRWGTVSGRLSLGIDVSWSGNPDTGSVQVTAVYYAKADGYGHNFSSTLRFSGDAGGSKAYSFYSPTGGDTVKELHRVTTAKYTQYGQSTTATFNVHTDPIWNGGQPSVSASVQIPARAYQAPGAVSSLRETRVDDGQINLSWSITSTSAAPVHQILIDRITFGGQWVRVANLPGAARSWADTTVTANQRYGYRVAGYNGKTGGIAESQGVSTTPAAPTNVTATKLPSGSILISWTRQAPYLGTGFRIYDNGTHVGTVGQSSAENVEWTHTNPSTTTAHTYTIVHTEVGGVESAHSNPSNTVQLLTRPLAPSATLQTTALAGTVTIKWAHASVDTTAQTRAEISYQINSSNWSSRTIYGDISEAVINVAALGTSPGTLKWKVRTWGAYLPGQNAGASPWSEVQTTYVYGAPLVGINSPANGLTVRGSQATVAWSFNQPQGQRQLMATVEVLTASGHTVSTKEVSGTATSLTVTGLQNGQSYRVRVRAVDGNLFESNTADVGFSVIYPSPAKATLAVQWDDTLGCASIAPTIHLPASGETSTARLVIQRSRDNGQTWVDLVALPTTSSLNVPLVQDFECLTAGTTQYRAVTYSADQAERLGTPISLAVKSDAIWIAGGSGFATAVPLRYDPKSAFKQGLISRKVLHFAGRPKGVELTGIQRSRKIDVSATLFDENERERALLEELAYMPGPFLLRDPLGLLIYVSLDGVDLARKPPGIWRVKFDLEEIEHE